jgi:hypothetical protein
MEKKLIDFVDSVETSIFDLAVDSMINEMLLHYQGLSNFDPEVVVDAKIRTSSFIEQCSKDLMSMWPCLKESIFEYKKIALASAQLGGTTDEMAISSKMLQSESERSRL